MIQLIDMFPPFVLIWGGNESKKGGCRVNVILNRVYTSLQSESLVAQVQSMQP